MKTAPIEAAEPTFTADGLPFDPRFGDVYHPQGGAFAQARQVFLGGNGLPQRWRGRERFVVLETGFGLGNNFLATWQAWRDDPQRPHRLEFISIERHPLKRSALESMHADSPAPDLARALVAQWPALTHDLHTLHLDGGAVRLLLAFGDVGAWMPALIAEVDAFYLDGHAPGRNPQMWQARLYKAMARLAGPDATVATRTAARAVREGLAGAGFRVELAQGGAGERDITLARFAPAFTPRRMPRRSAPAPQDHHALILGAGLAGCATAWALAEQGWRSTLLDRHAEVAQEASGNPAGLFHGTVHAQDGVHARWYRAAAFEARQAVRHAVTAGHAAGAADGLLRLEQGAGGVEAMAALLRELGLPEDFVQALDAISASERCGLTLRHPAWFHPGGGWVDPAGLARSFVHRAGDAVRWRPRTEVARIRRQGERWQVLDALDQVLDEAPALVLAGGGEALRLAGGVWPVEAHRGQISVLSGPAAASLAALRRPVSGLGYALRLADGRVVFGATSQTGDADPAVRAADHASNLSQLESLFDLHLDVDLDADAQAFAGRTGWRWHTRDRLPLIGAVPDVEAVIARELPLRLDQPRFVPRRPGLFVFAALGSRGITSAALGAQVLAALMSGAPCPIEASLLDAVDPARFISRESRRAPA